MSYKILFFILLMCGFSVTSDLYIYGKFKWFEVYLALGAFVVAFLFGVIEKKFEIRMRQKVEGLYLSEGRGDNLPRLPPPGRPKLTPLMWGIFAFGHVAPILWLLLHPDVEIGVGIALLTYWAIAVMTIIRGLNGHLYGRPVTRPAEPSDLTPDQTMNAGSAHRVIAASSGPTSEILGKSS